MTTQLRTEETKDTMRKLLRERITRAEIMAALKLSKSAYHRQLNAIRLEDAEWLGTLAQEEFVSEFRLAHENIVGIARKAREVADSAQKDRDKIDALRLAKEAELDAVTLLGEGPTVLALRKTRGLRDDHKTDLQKAS